MSKPVSMVASFVGHIRIGSLTLSLFGALQASAAPTYLQYGFDSSNSGLMTMRLTASSNFVNPENSTTSSSTQVDVQISDWIMPLLVTLSEDRQTAEFSPTSLEFQGPSVVAGGEFDLGFSGSVPYTVTLTSISVDVLGSINPLRTDASFSGASRFRMDEMRMEGTVDVLGSSIPFGAIAFFSNSSFPVDGQLSPEADPALIGITFGASGSGIAMMYTGRYGEFDLRIDSTVGLPDYFSDTTPALVPEPGTALLIGLGLLGLGLGRR